jgi:hypothetical protein
MKISKHDAERTGKIRKVVEFALRDFGRELFPFPLVPDNTFILFDCASFGYNFKRGDGGPPQQHRPPRRCEFNFTTHMKVAVAAELLGKLIVDECQYIIGQMQLSSLVRRPYSKPYYFPIDVKEVVWRFAEYGCQARNFLYVNDKDETWLLIKVGNRYVHRQVTPKSWEDEIAHTIPDSMAPLLMDAYYKWTERGEASWFHERQGHANIRKKRQDSKKRYFFRERARKARLQSIGRRGGIGFGHSSY